MSLHRKGNQAEFVGLWELLVSLVLNRESKARDITVLIHCNPRIADSKFLYRGLSQSVGSLKAIAPVLVMAV